MKNTETNTIEKCKAQLNRESIIKAVLCGMAVGLAVSFLLAFITWFFEFKGLWLSLGVGLAAWAASSVLFYFFKFKPSTADVMKRLDRAGLDERMITMYELRNDDSYIASAQRADASAAFTKAVAKSGGKLLKAKIPALVIALACVAGGVGIAANVVTGLSDYGVIPTGISLINGTWSGGPNNPANREYTVTYVVGADGGGKIEGLMTQKVRAGGNTETVKAVPVYDEENQKEYYFRMWVDEEGHEYKGTPLHSLRGVNQSKVFTAVFGEVNDDDIAFSYYYKPGDEEQDESEDSGEPTDNTDDSPSAPGGFGAGIQGGGDPADPSNTIIDGKTPYESLYETYRALAMEMLVNGTENYPPELVEIIEGYFGIL